MNYIYQGVIGVSTAVQDYAFACKESTKSIIIKLKELRNNPDIFQKVCQVAFAAIQYMNWQQGTNVLSKFSFALSTANMHDFYLIFKEPRQWLFPVQADAINASGALDSLVNVLQAAPAFAGLDQEIIKTQVAKPFLKAQLESMEANDDAYSTVNEFIAVLERKMRSTGHIQIRQIHVDGTVENRDIDLSRINLTDMKVSIFSTTLLEKITNATWLFVDVTCVGLYLQGWNLLDTAKWAERLGKYRPLNWATNQSLEAWVRGAVCFAYGTKLLEATRKLLDEKMTAQARSRAKWDVVTSVAELVFNGAGYLNKIGTLAIPAGFIHLSAIVAKSLGIISIVTRERPNYFATATAAAAA